MIIGGMIGAGAGRAKMCKLWANPEPTANFAAQTVTVQGVGEYQALLVRFKNQQGTSGVTRGESTNIIPTDGYNYQTTLVKQSNGQIALRVTSARADSVVFGAGFINGTTNNAYFVPLEIWGIE